MGYSLHSIGARILPVALPAGMFENTVNQFCYYLGEIALARICYAP